MTHTLYIEVSHELYERLNKAALERGMTLPEFCLAILGAAINGEPE